MAERTCQRKGCPGTLEGKRADAIYCSDACAREVRRERERGRVKGKVWIRGHWRTRPGKGRQASA